MVGETRNNEKGRILAIDVGNTSIIIGCVENDKIIFKEKLSTDSTKTELEYAIGFRTILQIHDIEAESIKGAIISSVVPQLVSYISRAVEKTVNITPLIVGPGVKTGLNIKMDQPKQLGGDLVIGAVAAIKEYGYPAIVIEMNTATTMSVIDENATYIGGVLMPGMDVAIESLAKNTAQLPRISIEKPDKVVGKNTVDCMKSGAFYGAICSIDGLLNRIIEETFSDAGKEPVIVATGGRAQILTPYCKHKIIVDDVLLLKGLKIVYDKNVGL